MILSMLPLCYWFHFNFYPIWKHILNNYNIFKFVEALLWSNIWSVLKECSMYLKEMYPVVGCSDTWINRSRDWWCWYTDYFTDIDVSNWGSQYSLQWIVSDVSVPLVYIQLIFFKIFQLNVRNHEIWQGKEKENFFFKRGQKCTLILSKLVPKLGYFFRSSEFLLLVLSLHACTEPRI